MNKKYGQEFIKLVASMISRGDFNKDLSQDYGYWNYPFKSNDIDSFLRYIDLNKTFAVNSLELKMLTGEFDDLTLLEHYDNPKTISRYEISAIDLLLYSSINNDLIFNKLINLETVDLSKTTTTLNKLMNDSKVDKAEELIKRGADMNRKIFASKITFVELELINIVTGPTFSKNKNREEYSNKLELLLKYKHLINQELFLIIEDTLNNAVNFIKDFYLPTLELKQADILTRVEEYISILDKLNYWNK